MSLTIDLLKISSLGFLVSIEWDDGPCANGVSSARHLTTRATPSLKYALQRQPVDNSGASLCSLFLLQLQLSNQQRVCLFTYLLVNG